LKNPLSSFLIKQAIDSSFRFSTKKIAFRYVDSKSPGIIFSLSKNLGSAVERNLFKRRARYFVRNELSKSVTIFVKPTKKLKKIKKPLNHFKLFNEHLAKKNLKL
jgi:ribonuclease P protein component